MTDQYIPPEYADLGLTEWRDANKGTGYVITPALYHRPGERPPTWTCACRRPDGRPLLKAKRHTEPWQCLPEDRVRAWWAQHPEIKTLANARRLMWMESEFDRTGLDRWDDAAGMTELQKGMFP